MADDLTTLAAVKLYSGITTDVDDTLLQQLITAYSQWVRSYCSRTFTPDTFEIWRDGRDQQFMLLPETPVLEVTLVEVDGRSIPAQSNFNSPGFRFTDTQLVLGGCERFCFGFQNVHVIYSAGFLTIPADLAQAVNEIVGLRYANHDKDKQGWTSKQLAGEVISLNTKDMPASVATVLKQYMRKVPA